MIGNVHHEAKAFDIIELTGLPTPGELYEPDCQLRRNALESIFHKPEPNMSQILSMMKPLPHDADYPKEFFVEDLEYLPALFITSSGELYGLSKDIRQQQNLKEQ